MALDGYGHGYDSGANFGQGRCKVYEIEEGSADVYGFPFLENMLHITKTSGVTQRLIMPPPDQIPTGNVVMMLHSNGLSDISFEIQAGDTTTLINKVNANLTFAKTGEFQLFVIASSVQKGWFISETKQNSYGNVTPNIATTSTRTLHILDADAVVGENTQTLTIPGGSIRNPDVNSNDSLEVLFEYRLGVFSDVNDFGCRLEQDGLIIRDELWRLRGPVNDLGATSLNFSNKPVEGCFVMGTTFLGPALSYETLNNAVNIQRNIFALPDYTKDLDLVFYTTESGGTTSSVKMRNVKYIAIRCGDV